MTTGSEEKSAAGSRKYVEAYLGAMTEAEKQLLLQDTEQIDPSLIEGLYALYQAGNAAHDTKRVLDTAEVISLPDREPFLEQRKRLIRLGEEYLRQGKVAIFLVAGGQGTRLGFAGPKGCFPVSPVKHKSLFQLFAESLRALQRRYGKPLQWYIMTSHENNGATLAFFEQNRYFDLSPKNIHFIIQKEIPSLDLSGKLIISPDKKIFKNPNGHGGALYAMQDSGALKEMACMGIDEIFYFQVDNPLAKIADPLFIGAHVDSKARMSTKVVRKTDPGEKVGVIGRINGKLGCIEYSELTPEQVQERTPDGRLRFSSGNIAIHMINRSFVEKLTTSPDFHLPYHSAVKQIECMKPDGTVKKIQG
ncbi:MAG: UTP--glucose-1-phosphate uridylyltransferase, partial [Pseudomonadota bacterium]